MRNLFVTTFLLLFTLTSPLCFAAADPGSRTADVTFDDAFASVGNILGATVAIGHESSVLAIGEGS